VLLRTGAAYVSIERITRLYRVILLGMDNVESRARRGEKLEENTGGLMGYRGYVSCKQKFGVEWKTEISDLCVPQYYSVLEVERCWGNSRLFCDRIPTRCTFSSQLCVCVCVCKLVTKQLECKCLANVVVN